MTRLFWELYLPTLAIIGGVGILTGVISGAVERAWRRWRCRREMQHAARDLVAGINASGKRRADTVIALEHEARTVLRRKQFEDVERFQAGIDEGTRRRQELDGLATARDKAERKIH